MKKIFLAGVVGVALLAAGAVTSADAADVYRKAPAVAPAPPAPLPFSWTGCFIGAHWGWGWGRKDIDEKFVETEDRIILSSFGASGRIDTSGDIFGGQVGCDYQFGWGKAPGGPGGWVIGIQFDGARTDINGFTTDPALAASDPLQAAILGRIAVKEDWLASLTGRLGVTGWGGGFWSQTLFYVRGGVAWTHEKWDLHGANFFFEANTGNFVLSPVDKSRTGWTVGAGWEWAFLPNWSAFVEWDHYDFGHKNVVTTGFVSGAFSGVATFDARQRVETVKVGVNYRFNFGKTPTPVVARY